MARIPYRALGRPLSGKNGRFNRTPIAAPVSHAEMTIEVVEPVAEPVADATQVAPEPTPEPVAAPQWEPTWTKSQILAVAQAKNLSVTSANTKAEIVAALTAAG